MKRNFTKKQLDAKIKQRWPGIGTAMRAYLVKALWRSNNFPIDVKLTDYCFMKASEVEPAEHLLSVLWKYAVPFQD
jgi:hypothetical protein